LPTVPASHINRANPESTAAGWFSAPPAWAYRGWCGRCWSRSATGHASRPHGVLRRARPLSRILATIVAASGRRV